MNNDIYIDIETHPDMSPGALAAAIEAVEPPGQYKKADSIAQWKAENAASIGLENWLRTALDPLAGGIYVIGYSIGGEAVATITRDPRTDADEGGWLNHALSAIAEAAHCHDIGRPAVPRFVGWNHLGFDLPFIAKRCVIHGIVPPLRLPLAQRYNGERVLDLMQAWSPNPRDWTKQSAVARALRLPIENEIDGSKLWSAVEERGVGVAAEKCAKDVAQLVEIHRRMSAVYGLAA